MRYHRQRLAIHQEHYNKVMAKDPEKYWVQQAECSRFTPEQKADADVLFRSIGIDPDLYMAYARAQIVRRD